MILQRSFHRRLTWEAMACILLLAACALYFLLQRSPSYAVIALVLVCIDVVMIERAIHTTYSFTAEGNLVVSRGRFSRDVVFPVSDITRVERHRPLLWGSGFLLITYGANHYISVQPDQENSFLDEIKRQQKKYDKENE